MSHPHPEHPPLADLAGGDPFRVQLASDVAAIRQSQDELAADVKEMRGLLEAWRSAKGAIRVLGWVGTAAKWVGYVAVGFGLLLAAAKTLVHLMTVADSRP